MTGAGRPLRVLFVEDSEDDFRILRRELTRGGFALEHRRVEDAAGLAAALDEPWDVVLCDYSLPGFGAMQAFALVQARGLDLPFLIVSGTIGEERAVEAMRAGVHDFILKDRLTRLPAAVEREVKEAASRAARRRAEEALLRTEKLRSLGQMATGIAHDLKNLLNPLGLHLELVDRALRKAQLEPPVAIETMREILRRGVETIDRLRAFGRVDPEPIAETLDLAHATREAIALVRPRLGERPELILREELAEVGTIHARGSEVIGAIVNLIVNAVDACGTRGTITVEVGDGPDGPWVAVADDGPGMTPEVAARVFEPFFSTKGEEGTGLGLANVFATMRRHGGDVLLTTAPARGARFTLRFPP
jgi:signal transduction histidine kinase